MSLSLMGSALLTLALPKTAPQNAK
jgi:hypothetical protein